MPSSVTDRLLGLTTSVAVKAPVLCASTANLTLSSTQVIDGVSVSTGDRVLVKDQTGLINNGIYVVDKASWSRSADCDGRRDLVIGTMVYVSTGSTENSNFERFFVFTSTSSTSAQILPGTDAMTIAQSRVLSVSSDITVSGFGETLVDDADAAAARTTLAVVIGTDVQAFDQDLTDLAAIAPSTGGILHYTAGSTIAILTAGSSGNFLQIGAAIPLWSHASTEAVATQAEMEAATVDNAFASPGTVRHHPGVAKAWSKFDLAGTENASHNTDSVSDTGTGDWTVNITTDFSSVNYVVVPGMRDDSALQNNHWMIGAQAVGSFQYLLGDSAGAAIDPAAADDMHAVAFGDQ